MTTRGLVLCALASLLACSRSAEPPAAPAPRGSAVRAATPAPSGALATDGRPAPAVRADGKLGTARSKPAAVAMAPDRRDAGATEIVEMNELNTEEPEANPYSESVTLKLAVSPQVKALVLWGARQMAHLEPGKMNAEINRPRGSGPLDVEIKAEGYLPYHTRLYADRNDKVSVRLYRPEDAPNLFGYKRSPEGRKSEAEKPK